MELESSGHRLGKSLWYGEDVGAPTVLRASKNLVSEPWLSQVISPIVAQGPSLVTSANNGCS